MRVRTMTAVGVVGGVCGFAGAQIVPIEATRFVSAEAQVANMLLPGFDAQQQGIGVGMPGIFVGDVVATAAAGGMSSSVRAEQWSTIGDSVIRGWGEVGYATAGTPSMSWSVADAISSFLLEFELSHDSRVEFWGETSGGFGSWIELMEPDGGAVAWDFGDGPAHFQGELAAGRYSLSASSRLMSDEIRFDSSESGWWTFELLVVPAPSGVMAGLTILVLARRERRGTEEAL